MANVYVRHLAGGTPDGVGWATAWLTLAAAMTGRTAADVIWVANDHSESTAAAVVIACPTALGLRILGANTNVTEPPTGLSSTPAAIVAVGSVSQLLSIVGSAFIYGIYFKGGISSSSNASIALGGASDASLVFDTCKFELRNTASTPTIRMGGNAAATELRSSITVLNSAFSFPVTGSSLALQSGDLLLRNITVETAGSAPTTLITCTTNCSGICTIEASDLNGCAYTNLINLSQAALHRTVIRNCKLPSGVTVATGTIPAMGTSSLEMDNCDGADTNFRMARHSYTGTVLSESTIGLTGGALGGQASAGTDLTVFSWNMTSSANAKFPASGLESPEIVQYNSTTGGSKTVTVEFLIDSATTLYKEDVWLAVTYLGTSGFPLAVPDADSKLGILSALATTECDAGVGAATWAGEAGGAKSYKLVSTITPQEKGYIHARVVLAKASTTIYVDPKLTVA